MKLVGEVAFFKKGQGFGFGFIEVKIKMVGAGHAITRYYLAEKEIEFSIPEKTRIGNWVRFNPGPQSKKPGAYPRALSIEVFETREQIENAVLIEQMEASSVQALQNSQPDLVAGLLSTDVKEGV